ncbi:MAG: response regulator [Gammaproteobacteria bacterium]|nr:response regulator [Gammaproteobacteria bacterium]
MDLHSTLARQLRRLRLDPDHPPADAEQWRTFLQRVGAAYADGRQDVYLLQRSLEVSSREMQALYAKLEASAESRVAAERDHLGAIINAFSDGFCHLDLDGRVVTINPAAEQILGADTIGQPLLPSIEFHEQGEMLAAGQLLARLRGNEILRDDNARLVHANGVAMPVAVLLFPITQGGEVTGIGMTLRDIRARLERERRLRRLRMAVDASADAIFITDPTAHIEYANVAFTRITGWPVDEVHGKSPNILRSGYTPSTVYQEMWATLHSGRQWSGRLRNRRRHTAEDPDGRLYWAQTTITPYTDDKGGLLGYIAVQRDVSDEVANERQREMEAGATRLRAEVAALLQTGQTMDERLRQVLTRIAIAVDGRQAPVNGVIRLIAANGEHHDMRVGDTDRLPADWDRDLGAPLEAPVRIVESSRCLASAYGGHEHGVIRLAINHAHTRMGELTIFTESVPQEDPILIENYQLIGEMLGLAVAEDRTRAAAEDARRAAIEAAEAKSKFLANMSHEIRTPMNGVLGMLDILEQTSLTAKQREYVQVAHGSAESLLTVINDILDFSKIEAGKMQIECIPFDVRTATEDVATLFSAPAQQKRIELACFVAPDVPGAVEGDPTRLRQVLTNILGNAIKFTTDGEVVVRANAVPDLPGHLRFEVRDTGIGMTAETITGLFQPFSQADGSTTRKFGGTGLGLAISKQLVELMGGRMGVDSRLGEGSRFWFELPMQTVPTAGGAAEAATDLSELRVLIVDDSETNREILSHYLASWNVGFDTANDAFEALDRMRAAVAASRPYQVVLLDMQMPNLDGGSLAEYVKADPALRDADLVVVSSTGLDSKELRDIGVRYAITKPVRQSLIRDILLELSGRRRRKPDSATTQTDLPRLHGHVLLAEDNLVNQQVARGMMDKLGVRVTVANDGAQALAMLAGADFDLILMDCQMPVMDGFEATRALRDREPDGARLPVIAMTANAMTGDREACIAAGMDDYLSKPVKLHDLHDMLARWLHRPAADDTVESRPPERTPMSSHSPIDMETVNTLRSIMEDSFPVLIDAYLSETPKLLENIDTSIANGDPAGLRLAAHSLKSSSANMGAMALSETARDLEHLGRDGHLEGIGDLAVTARAQYEQVKAALLAL